MPMIRAFHSIKSSFSFSFPFPFPSPFPASFTFSFPNVPSHLIPSHPIPSHPIPSIHPPPHPERSTSKIKSQAAVRGRMRPVRQSMDNWIWNSGYDSSKRHPVLCSRSTSVCYTLRLISHFCKVCCPPLELISIITSLLLRYYFVITSMSWNLITLSLLILN